VCICSSKRSSEDVKGCSGARLNLPVTVAMSKMQRTKRMRLYLEVSNSDMQVSSSRVMIDTPTYHHNLGR